MLPDRVSNPGPLTYESGALPKNESDSLPSYLCYGYIFITGSCSDGWGVVSRKL